jgi:rare lipoprotein A
MDTAQAQSTEDVNFGSRFHFEGAIVPAPAPNAEGTRLENGRATEAPYKSFLKNLFVAPAAAAAAPSAPTEQAADLNTSQPELRSTELRVPSLPRMKRAASKPLKREPRISARERRIAAGRAAYYEHAGRTASGEQYNPDGLTAAHKTLPLGTRLRIVHARTGKSVLVRVNDRAPAKMRYLIDLSRGSARAIGITKQDGVGPVAIYKVE